MASQCSILEDRNALSVGKFPTSACKQAGPQAAEGSRRAKSGRYRQGSNGHFTPAPSISLLRLLSPKLLKDSPTGLPNHLRPAPSGIACQPTGRAIDGSPWSICTSSPRAVDGNARGRGVCVCTSDARHCLQLLQGASPGRPRSNDGAPQNGAGSIWGWKLQERARAEIV